MDFGSWDHEDTFTIDTLSNIIKECHRILKKGGTLIMFYDLWKNSRIKRIDGVSQIEANLID